MFIGIVRIFTIFLRLVIFIFTCFGVFGIAMAQSILSDRLWFEKIIEKNLTKQKNSSSFSGMMHAPLIINHTDVRPLLHRKSKLIFPEYLPPKTSLSQNQTHYLANETAILNLNQNLTLFFEAN